MLSVFPAHFQVSNRCLRVPFTLVELLVVVGILGILMALLLRQLGLGLHLYAEAEDGWMAPSYAPGPAGSWLNRMRLRLGTGAITACPAADPAGLFDAPGGSGPYAGSLPSSYLMNACNPGTGINGWDTAALTDKDRWLGWTAGIHGAARYARPVRLGRVKRPSTALHVVESTAAFRHLSAPNRANAGKQIDRWRQTDRGEPISGGAYVNRRKVGSPHGGRFQALFGDGSTQVRAGTEVSAWTVWRR